MIEAALALAGGEEWYGYDERVLRRVLMEFEHCCGEPPAEDVFGEGALAFELEQVEEFAGLGVVGGVADGAGEGGRSEAAGGAFGDAEGGGEAHGLGGDGFAAAGAEGVGGARSSGAGEARAADSRGGEFCEGSAAEAAVGGKEGGGEVGGGGLGRTREGLGTSEHARDRAPSCCAPMAGRAFTAEFDILHVDDAEDGPHSRHREKKHQLCRWVQYSRAAKVVQSGLWNLGWCGRALSVVRMSRAFSALLSFGACYPGLRPGL